jgi:hypothetical protein
MVMTVAKMVTPTEVPMMIHNRDDGESFFFFYEIKKYEKSIQ